MSAVSSLTVQQKKLALWLLICTALIFIMIVIGGLTRLTGSGLSIVHWQPITGIIPPLSVEGWQTLFQDYQQSPEYQQINRGMDLQEFKSIFWLEFIHRFWGRLIGLVFLVPLVLAWQSPDLRKSFFFKLAGIWLLGGLQGVVGWYMVKSGLIHDPHVSHYRLALHLLLGFTTYGLTLHYTLQLLSMHSSKKISRNFNKALYGALFGLTVLTIFYGALVAGLKAGLVYNTFPTMNGAWLPPEFLALEPLYRNFTENHAAVQWMHRILALSTLILSGLFCWLHRANRFTFLLLGVVCIQVIIGIVTLLWQVPVTLGTLHQVGALLVLSSLIFIQHLSQASFDK